MLTKNTFYIGLNDKNTKLQQIDNISAFKIVANILLGAGIEGATISQAQGIYKHDNGEIVIENTLRVEVVGANQKALLNAIEQAKSALNQESVLHQVENITSQFI